ncbi:hypothetical protein MRX96_003303 [Rhipicephalus microplus]
MRTYCLRMMKTTCGPQTSMTWGEAQASATCDDCEVLASVPQLPASTSVSTTEKTAASSSGLVQDLSPSPSPGILNEPSPRPTLNTTLDPTSTRHPSPILDPTRGSSPASSSGPSTGPTPGPTQGPTSGLFPLLQRGICVHHLAYASKIGILLLLPRKRREDPHLQFFEKRLQHEKGARSGDREMEKERLALERERLAVEDHHITLERDRLTLDREVFLQKKREWEETQEEKKEERLARQREREQERELYLRQQGALINLVKSVVENIQK